MRRRNGACVDGSIFLSCAETAGEGDDHTDEQDQTERTATDNWAADVKTAAAQENEKEKNK